MSKRRVPALESGAEAEAFVAAADLIEEDLSVLKPVHFEFAPKANRVNMRLPAGLLKAIKAKAAQLPNDMRN